MKRRAMLKNEHTNRCIYERFQIQLFMHCCQQNTFRHSIKKVEYNHHEHQVTKTNIIITDITETKTKKYLK